MPRVVIIVIVIITNDLLFLQKMLLIRALIFLLTPAGNRMWDCKEFEVLFCGNSVRMIKFQRSN